MIARRLSQIFALALAALTYWVMIWLGGIDPEFAWELHIIFALFVAVLFALLFVALRLGCGGTTIYWSTGPWPNQVAWIATLIVVALAIQLSAGWILDLQERLDEASRILAIFVWTLVPAAFLAFRLVKWPTRLRSASKLRLFLGGTVAACFAILMSHSKFANGPADFELPSVGILTISGANILVLAAAEEVVCRVLLLTALLDLIRSRFHAVFLSSVVFGLVHAPLALAQPAMHGDWSMLQFAAQSYAPEFLVQTLLGLALGVLWLRTGSITLVVLIHAIFNVGPILLTGL